MEESNPHILRDGIQLQYRDPEVGRASSEPTPNLVLSTGLSSSSRGKRDGSPLWLRQLLREFGRGVLFRRSRKMSRSWRIL